MLRIHPIELVDSRRNLVGGGGSLSAGLRRRVGFRCADGPDRINRVTQDIIYVVVVHINKIPPLRKPERRPTDGLS